LVLPKDWVSAIRANSINNVLYRLFIVSRYGLINELKQYEQKYNVRDLYN